MNKEFLTFEKWKESVAIIVYAKFRCNLDDLPNENYSINYNNNMTSVIMANIVIENNLNKFFK